MPSASQWLTFVIASALFIQVPGPSLLFTLGRALSVGRREAQWSVLGNGAGLLVQVIAVALGLGAVVSASATAYSALRLVGAGYVVYLGVRAIRHRSDARSALATGAPAPREGAVRALRAGLVVGTTNPKTIVFFVAFLPQFIDVRAGHPGLQLLLLGATFGAMAVTSDSVWARAASRARDWFARKPQRLDRLGALGGVLMIALGVTLAASE